MLSLQLCALGLTPGFGALKERVIALAAALAGQFAIPAVREHLALIEEVQGETWWEDVGVDALERVRKRLRGLVHLIEKRRREPIYTDFEDEIGEGTELAFAAFTAPSAFEAFRAKARHFLRQHQDHVAIHKLRTNRQLTPTDLEELERILLESGVGTAEDIERAKAGAEGLGLFVRSLVGMDRAAAKEAFAGFLTGRMLTANQIELVGMIVDDLTENGAMDAARLWESPYTDLNPRGVEGVFPEDEEVLEVMSILDEVRRRAAA